MQSATATCGIQALNTPSAPGGASLVPRGNETVFFEFTRPTDTGVGDGRLHPKPENPNSKPETRNPKLETRNR